MSLTDAPHDTSPDASPGAEPVATGVGGPTVAPGPRRRRVPWSSVGLVAAVVVLWELVGRFAFDSDAVMPPPSDVVVELLGRWSTYTTHITSTASAAAWGWLWGNAIAVGIGILAVVFPFLESWAMRIAVAVTSLPIIALGPIFQVTLDGSGPKIALAALSVVLTTLVGTIVGLTSADPTSLDLVSALGGDRWDQMRRVRFRAALPPFFTALRISAPAAVLGAIIGEFLGRVETGLGVALVNAQRNVQTDRVWAIALLATAMAGLGYAAIAFVGRRLTPWAGSGVGS
ncbi:ABC transporter permease [Ilumatobacter sp.]|uniref:ABC transporter permease n=1 Tax=Ilumatobacter sp. TaxID=1967498 RepID=UPI003B52050C